MKKNRLFFEHPNNLISLLKKGEDVLSFKLKDKVEDVLKITGKPDKIMGNKEMGFYEFANGVRIGYFSDYVDEFVIMFSEVRNVSFIINSPSKIEISKNTTVLELLKILNYHKIQWRNFEEINPDNLSFITSSGIIIMFDIEDKCLFRFVYSSVSKAIVNKIKWQKNIE